MIENGRYVDNMDVEGSMPPGVREVFEHLRYEVAWLHAKWAIYSQLYCRGEEQLAFLDSVAPGFFVVIRDSLENELIVGLCRLTDDAKRGNNENLTLARLRHSLSQDQEGALREQFAAGFERVRQMCSPLRKWRNRRLAHSDFPTILGKASDALPDIAWQNIDEALVEVRALMNLVERYFLNSELHYESFTDLDDGEEIVFYLREAQKFEEEERNRAMGKSTAQPHDCTGHAARAVSRKAVVRPKGD